MIACAAHDTDYARRCYEEGRSLRQNGEYVEAMHHFVSAAQSNTDDHSLLGRVYSNMANMCRQAEQHDLAFSIYTISAQQFAQTQDSLAYAYALNNMAWEQAVLGHKDSALTLVDSAITICPSEELLSKVAESQSAAYLYAEQYDSALFYSAHINNAYGHILRAQAFSLSKQCDSALRYARLIIDETSNPRYLDDAYYILAHCDSKAQVDKILDITSTRTDVQRELEQQKTRLAQAIIIMQQGLNPHKSPLKWVIIALCILLIMSTVMFIAYTRCRQRSKTISREKQLTITCQELMNSGDLKHDLHLDNYAEFRSVCNERFFGLVDKLEERELSEREIRICIMVLIGLSYAQIADLLNRAQNGIGKDKYVIAQKLGFTVKDLQTILQIIALQNE